MPRLIPEQPTFVTESERVVWEQLRKDLRDDDVVIANLRLTDETKDHEIDLIVLMPEVGICVLEVKGSGITYDNGWWMRTPGQSRPVYPVDQAADGKYAVRTFTENDRRWGSRGRVNWTHSVVTPFTEFGTNFTLPDLPRSALHDRGDQPDLVGRIRQHTFRYRQDARPPSSDDVDAIVDILTGNWSGYDQSAEAEERAATANRLTQEQASILQVTRLLNRIEVRGGAGSGKTVLALEQARQLTSGRNDRPAQRVALLCYSLGLAAHLKRVVATWPRRQRPAFVGNFHEFGMQWGAPDYADRTNSRFWDIELPETMADLAHALPDGHRYDAVIVDEAQDFADLWWNPVLAALRDEERSGVYVYSDENQRIFARYGRPPVDLIPLVLDHNLRNTKQICEVFSPMAPSRMYARGGHGPAVQFVATTPEGAIDRADEEIDRLLDEGWKEEHLCLLTTGARHPEQVSRTDHSGQQGYWETYWDPEQVFYGHVLGCKGLERKVVVLCVNEDTVRDRGRERLYVGMSRATDLLVVVGAPEVIRATGGPEVATRLGIA
ncbi:nuclease-related domain-containing DEAD/DEAH box helicase [Smaragdicoccus niigatensis]|uniref:nuclease-related domain-containing DEAD/DEAH box helicase n=1 Tax=Smaragdicoccus niigatensis TaxID=359359 RepID=UPI00058F6D7E|nr:NERD domain-containing protein [Smaragdicoccus niigatensis]